MCCSSHPVVLQLLTCRRQHQLLMNFCFSQSHLRHGNQSRTVLCLPQPCVRLLQWDPNLPKRVVPPSWQAAPYSSCRNVLPHCIESVSLSLIDSRLVPGGPRRFGFNTSEKVPDLGPHEGVSCVSEACSAPFSSWMCG